MNQLTNRLRMLESTRWEKGASRTFGILLSSCRERQAPWRALRPVPAIFHIIITTQGVTGGKYMICRGRVSRPVPYFLSNLPQWLPHYIMTKKKFKKHSKSEESSQASVDQEKASSRQISPNIQAPWKRNVILLLALLCIYFFSIYIRSHILSHLGKGDYIPYYNTESASYFRYAEMVSRGQEVPAVDYKAQAPDGFQVFNTPIIMEYIVGSLHRLPFFNDIPLLKIIFLCFLAILCHCKLVYISYILMII